MRTFIKGNYGFQIDLDGIADSKSQLETNAGIKLNITEEYLLEKNRKLVYENRTAAKVETEEGTK